MIDFLNASSDSLIQIFTLMLFIIIYLIFFFSQRFFSNKNNFSRIFILILLIILILNPSINKDKKEYYKDIVLLVSDKSLSISETNKTEEVLNIKKKIINKIQNFSDIEIRNIEISNKNFPIEKNDQGTFIIRQIKQEINSLNKKRIAGIIVITDGQIFDKPKIESALSKIPLHFIIAGSKNEKDRVIITEGIPNYAIIGEKIKFSLKIDSWIDDNKIATDVFLDGKNIFNENLIPNKFHEIEVPIYHSGKNILEIRISQSQNELTFFNNKKIREINGIHDKLRVMLISGEPNMGLRSWRNILNSDPSIELIHFTILRPPSKRDFTPVKELSLIPFPTQELFAADISKFSLIIFDQYSLQGVLPEKYMNNITEFVLKGGALLDIAGSNHTSQNNIINSPIKKILPSKSEGKNFVEAFTPKLTEIGKRHPITNNLDQNYEVNRWGEWYRHIKTKKIFGKTLLENDNYPIMIVGTIGKGRVAQILSDQSWIWIKSNQNKGPLISLLRNTIHWLLKNPELEEDFFTFSKEKNLIKLRLNTLNDQDAAAKIYHPTGKVTNLLLKNNARGQLTGSFLYSERGKYKIIANYKEKVFYPDSKDIIELERVLSSDKKLKEFVKLNNNISLYWADEKIPEITKIYNNNNIFGKNWIGIIERKIRKDNLQLKQSLIPWYFLLPFIIILFLLVWYRENKI